MVDGIGEKKLYHAGKYFYHCLHQNKRIISAVPGIDAAYLAMDIEEGLEVIWNEVKFSESKDYRAQEKQMSSALDSMISITHPNIVKVKILNM